MPDFLSPDERSRTMAKVKVKDTAIELRVRSLLHQMGYRFRLHAPDLPGKPDIVLSRHKTIIFVHGCFWHQHPGCPKSKRPSTHKEFWNKKLDDNISRDEKTTKLLKQLGWQVVTVWECEIRNSDNLAERLTREIKNPDATETS